ncbi:MAG: acyl-CoA dehydrogenase family protein, partial [Acidimicrobiales bacterium]
MQVAELFAPPPEVAGHPAVAAARQLCGELLEPHAAAADDPAGGVRREHLDALAAAGLASVTVPADEGGLGASQAVNREVVELLAGACGATWFLLTQHQLPQDLSRKPLADLDPAVASAGPGAQRYRDALARAAALGGVAVAHFRRPTPVVTAEPDGRGGYLLTGHADWCTGWGLLDLLLVAATTPDDRLVFGIVEAAERDGLRAAAPLPLSVMGGTATVALELQRCALVADEVVLTVATGAWRELDRARTANTKPAAVGLLRRVLVELERLGHVRDRPEAVDAAR